MEDDTKNEEKSSSNKRSINNSHVNDVDNVHSSCQNVLPINESDVPEKKIRLGE